MTKRSRSSNTFVRNDRPVGELLTADYDFLNAPLAKYYGISREIKSKNEVEMVEGANTFHRGGLLRLGAVLTATSAPLRTSPVRRGDWVLRRILGTAVPPPPADAGSIPADDKLFGGLSVRERLQVHKRNATCATCHTRIDPLGFPLEHYDSTGRWREQYPTARRSTITAISPTIRASTASRACWTIWKPGRRSRCSGRWLESWWAMRWAARFNFPINRSSMSLATAGAKAGISRSW